jgi:putative amide transporter protein
LLDGNPLRGGVPQVKIRPLRKSAAASIEPRFGVASSWTETFHVLYLLAVFYSAANISKDPFLSVLWLSWAALWSLFFLVLAGGKSSLSAFTGWAAVLAGQITTTAPALLGLSGAWPTGWFPAGLATVVIAGLFTAALVISKSARSRTPAGHGPVPAAVAEPVSA